MRLPKNLAA
jgi:hypothetical protein